MVFNEWKERALKGIKSERKLQSNLNGGESGPSSTLFEIFRLGILGFRAISSALLQIKSGNIVVENFSPQASQKEGLINYMAKNSLLINSTIGSWSLQILNIT